MLFLFTFNGPMAEFTSMLWVIILHDYKSLTHKLCSRRDCVMLLYTVIVVLIQFALHLVQIPNLTICKSPPHHNRTSSSWCNTGGCSSFTNSSPHIDPPIYHKDFKLWFVNPKDFVPLLDCSVFVRLGPLEPFDRVLLPWLVSWPQFCPIGQLHRVLSSQWILTHFLWQLLNCAMILGAVSFRSCRWVTLIKLFSALVVAFGLV